MKANHNSAISGRNHLRVVSKIVEKKNESKSQRMPTEHIFLICCVKDR